MTRMNRTLGRALAVLALSGLGVGSSTSSAFADAALVEATPADNATLTLDQAQEVSFRFNDRLNDIAAVVVVLDPNGQDVSAGDVEVEEATATRTFEPADVGTYQASYRVVSSDGHPVTGTISFDITAPVAAEPAPTPSAPVSSDSTGAAEPNSRPASEADDGRGAPWTPILIVAVAVVALAAAGVSVRRHKPDA